MTTSDEDLRRSLRLWSPRSEAAHLARELLAARERIAELEADAVVQSAHHSLFEATTHEELRLLRSHIAAIEKERERIRDERERLRHESKRLLAKDPDRC